MITLYWASRYKHTLESLKAVLLQDLTGKIKVSKTRGYILMRTRGCYRNGVFLFFLHTWFIKKKLKKVQVQLQAKPNIEWCVMKEIYMSFWSLHLFTNKIIEDHRFIKFCNIVRNNMALILFTTLAQYFTRLQLVSTKRVVSSLDYF